MRTVIHFMEMSSTKYGGLERFMISLIKHNYQKYNFVLVYDEAPASEDYVNELNRYEVQIIVKGKARLPFISDLSTYCKIIRKHRPEIVHFHFSTRHFYNALLAKCLGVKKIYKTQHSCITNGLKQVNKFSDLSLKQKFLSLWRLGIMSYTRVFFVSEYTLKQFSNIYGPSNKYVQVYLGIEKTESVRAIDRVDLKIDDTKKVLLSILFANPIKGADVLIRALAKTDDCVLMLIGLDDSLYTEELKAMARQLGVYDRIRWIGIVDEVAPYIKISDIYIQPSRTEALSLAACEAMAYAKPVIGSNIGGLPESSSIVFRRHLSIYCLSSPLLSVYHTLM